jgi:heptosyltransferase-3
MTGNILVIRGGAIGDFVLTFPALAALRKKFPGNHFEILGYPRIANLALLGKLADAVHPIEDPGLAPFFVRDAELPERWAKFFATFDLIISYAFDPEQILEDNIMRCSKAKFIAAAHRPNESETTHATAFFLKPLQQLGATTADSIPRLEFFEKASEDICVALHPGSGSPGKNWPEERWADLLSEILTKTTWRCLLIGGEAEGNRLERLQKRMACERLKLANHLPLTELAQRLRRCTAFVGHDSGITHLAAAIGLPVLALWGPTNEMIWRPLGERIVILHGRDKLSQIPSSKVFEELEGLVNP